MKWTNKGHQFDGIGSRFEHVEHVYIYGSGKMGKSLYDRLAFLNVADAFVDRDSAKQKTGYLNLPVLSQQEFLALDRTNSIVIVAMADCSSVARVLRSQGFQDGVNLFFEPSFTRYYLSMLALYGFGKLYVPRIGIETTVFCSLRCKDCCVLAPYVKNPAHKPLEEFKESVDAVFSRFDHMESFYFSGGESLLHPQIQTMISYVLGQYGDKIDRLGVITNGLFPCSDGLTELLRHPKASLEWSDYNKDLGDAKLLAAINQNIARMQEAGVRVLPIRHTTWLDFGFKSKRGNGLNEAQLIEFYDICGLCGTGCIPVIGKSMYPCANGYLLAERALGIADQESLIPLESEDPRHSHVLLEAYFGFCEKGYLEVCRYCDGFIGVNSNTVPVGAQLEQVDRL